MKLKHFFIMVPLLCLSFLIGCGNISDDGQYAKPESSTKEETKEIPVDIILKLKHDFEDEEDLKESFRMINHVRQDVLNVSWTQLSRAIILIADGDINVLKKIVESKYNGDPRDVIIEMMSIAGNTNDHGMTPFEIKY